MNWKNGKPKCGNDAENHLGAETVDSRQFLVFTLNFGIFFNFGRCCHAAAQINRRGVLLFAPPEIVFNSEAGNIFCELVLKFLIRHFS
jgi:hypothetical protein